MHSESFKQRPVKLSHLLGDFFAGLKEISYLDDYGKEIKFKVPEILSPKLQSALELIDVTKGWNIREVPYVIKGRSYCADIWADKGKLDNQMLVVYEVDERNRPWPLAYAMLEPVALASAA
jgi:hypothetical protein